MQTCVKSAAHEPPWRARRTVMATLLLALAVEGALAAGAIVLGRWLGIDPYESMRWEWRAFLVGLLAAAPMLAGFLALWRSRARSILLLRSRVESGIRALFRDASALHVALVSLAAGLAEEGLFRGLVQGWLTERLGAELALYGASLVFGLAHPVTRVYVLVASVFGVYLGWLWQVSGNLLAPVTAHAAYDFLVILILLRDVRWNEPMVVSDALRE